MSDTWLKTTVDPATVSWMFDPKANALDPPINGDVWFELHQKNGYVGWVCIKKDGTIEIGEPGV